MACQRSIPSAYQKKALMGEMTSWSVSGNTSWGTVSCPWVGSSPMLLNLIIADCYKAAFLNCCHGNHRPVQLDIWSVGQNCKIWVFWPFCFDLASFLSPKCRIAFTDWKEIIWWQMQSNFLLCIAPKWRHLFLTGVMTLTLFCGGEGWWFKWKTFWLLSN